MAIFRKQYTKPLPHNAEAFEKDGKRYARWTDRDGKKRKAEVFTNRKGAQRVRLETSTLTIKYRDAAGVVREASTGCTSRSAVQGIQTDLRRRRELVRAGVVSPGEEETSRHAATAINEHVDGYLRHLALIASPEHIANVTRQMKRLVAECRFGRLGDLSADRLERWLGQHRREGMGARTANTYLAAMHSFASWCVDGGRLLANPFARVPKADEKSDRRHQRRALTEDEVGRLLTVARLRPVAEYGRTVQKTTPVPDQRKRSNWQRSPLTFETIADAAERGRAALSGTPSALDLLERRGRERALIYRTLLQTGLRLGELASITLGQLDLEAAPAVLMLEPADEKNRKGSIIPLREDLAVEIRDFLHTRTVVSFAGGRPRGSTPAKLDSSVPLFDVPDALSRVFNRDLVAAGIPKRDPRGRVVDVHAMRHTFGTNLCRAGVPLRTAQAAMRHSDPKLTANVYTDPVLLDVAGAVNALPALPALSAQITSTKSATPAKAPATEESDHAAVAGA